MLTLSLEKGMAKLLMNSKIQEPVFILIINLRRVYIWHIDL